MKFLLAITVLVVASNALPDHSLWTEFKTKHGRQYDVIEDKRRFQVFQNNLRQIEQHNEKYAKGEVSYYLKVTKFADWTKKEISSMFDRPATIKPLPSTAEVFKADPDMKIPESFDWREKGAVFAVKDQGVCPASWPFSTTGCIEGQLAINNKSHIDLSEQELVDCSFDYGNIGCKYGNALVSFQYIRDNGISSERNYPYNYSEGTCQQKEKSIPTLSEIKRIAPDEESLAQAIATIGPIAVSVRTILWTMYGGGVFEDETCNYYYPTEAVLAVGYTPEYWILKNSWGDNWGEEGYIKLLRGKNMCGVNRENTYALL